MKKPKRIVLGTGHPWFLGQFGMCVALSKKNASTPLDGILVPLKIKDLGAYNKIRLVAEVLK